MTQPVKRKIAVLGGGVGAMTAAFELTNYPGWEKEHEITVYQMGWRLGGKGASGRNAQIADRIEEHGLHFWMGFYENAFNVIRQVYDECRVLRLMPNSPFQDWERAFTGQDTATAMEQVNGNWVPWSMYHPPNDARPGDPSILENEPFPSPSTLYSELLKWLFARTRDVLDIMGEFAADIPEWITAIVPHAAGFRSRLHLIAEVADSVIHHSAENHSNLLDVAEDFYQEFLAKAATANASIQDDVRHARLLLDAGLAAARGMIRDNVIFAGFENIDQYDLIEWLQKHGMKEPSNPFVRSGYDTAFAYAGGDPAKPNISAGVALYGLLRMMLTYRGSIFWRMNAGMGDIVFAPLYLVLKKRGVNFEFFHRVTALHLAQNEHWVESIDMDVQAELIDSVSVYDPLVEVKGHPCWPNAPKYDQLKNPDAIKGQNLESDYSQWCVKQRTLRRHADFDDIVLGIPVGALSRICPELIQADSAWKKMVDSIGTVQTQSAQLWMSKSADDLGFPPDPNQQPACTTAFVKPFDTWADMTHLTASESWTPNDNVKHIAYLCNILPEAPPDVPRNGTFPASQTAVVKANVLNFVQTGHANQLWPKFAMNDLVDRSGLQGAAKLDSQYFRANIDASERYVLSLKGTTKYRLHPEASGFVDLYLAGDWTWNLLNVGCVEAAAISGKLAARAICGHPQFIYGAFGRLVKPAVAVAAAAIAPAAAAVVATDPQEVREKWKRILLADLPPRNEVLLRCQAITSRYVQWYVDHSPLYNWAGVAAFVCYRISFALTAYNLRRHGIPVPDSVLNDLDLLRKANNDFFEEVGWALLAYISPNAGFAEVARGLSDYKPDSNLVQAFAKLETARNAPNTAEAEVLIWEATHLIELHGQYLTQTEFWTGIDSEAFKLFMTSFTQVDFDANPFGGNPAKTTTFSTYMWKWGWPILIRTGFRPDITNFDQRWYWIEKSVMPLWKDVQKLYSKELADDLKFIGGGVTV